MSLDGTYAGLKASVADFLNRADLTAIIPDFIVLAEAQMLRRFWGRQKQGFPIPRRLTKRTTLSISSGDEFETLPTDFVGPYYLVLPNTDGTFTELKYLDPEAFQAEKVRAFWTGQPRYYTVVGTSYQLYPVADANYTAQHIYIARPAAVSSSVNWILTDHPDAYLYGALTASAPYLQDDSRVTLWGTLFEKALDDICESDPMPSDKSVLTTEFPAIMWRGARYNINTDC